MSAFALFFLWLAALRRGRVRVRDFGMIIIVWVHEQLEAAEFLTERDVARFHGWLDWAEWAARRADPAAARALVRPPARDLRGLALRMAACCRVLAEAPARPPRRRRKVRARPSSHLAPIAPAMPSARALARRARDPPGV